MILSLHRLEPQTNSTLAVISSLVSSLSVQAILNDPYASLSWFGLCKHRLCKPSLFEQTNFYNCCLCKLSSMAHLHAFLIFASESPLRRRRCCWQDLALMHPHCPLYIPMLSIAHVAPVEPTSSWFKLHDQYYNQGHHIGIHRSNRLQIVPILFLTSSSASFVGFLLDYCSFSHLFFNRVCVSFQASCSIHYVLHPLCFRGNVKTIVFLL